MFPRPQTSRIYLTYMLSLTSTPQHWTGECAITAVSRLNGCSRTVAPLTTLNVYDNLAMFLGRNS